MNSTKRAARLRRSAPLLALAAPGVLLLLAFQYYPLIGNVIAFKDYLPFVGVWESPWVGLENFELIARGDHRFVNALTNTLIITLVQVLLVFPVPIALALALNSMVSERIKRLVQSVLYLPHFLSWVIVVAVFQQFLGGAGMINNFLRANDLDTFSLIGNADLFIPLVTSQLIWKDAGWATILFLAVLSQIDTTLYEASTMDGAGRFRQMWHITLPALKGIVILLLILRLGDALSVGFEQIILQQPAVGIEASEVLDTYVYNVGIVDGSWSEATAVGLVKGIVSVLLVLGANKLAHLFGEDGLYRS
ncbi:sugar ABC transporter permease [Occultella aeris]|uniref:Putative multiple-sugar transport system permease YteP n=1 Tax=Occultella aeris TaxID=2761496 RepID=A0A7M4DRA0_9MICO|nr:ABC transporter permease subunit [Occultella aeris]VZO39994.1 putative multiple-sugar transport system permease YteP [Occultella aeris]